MIAGLAWPTGRRLRQPGDLVTKRSARVGSFCPVRP
jgi:hypothetical protein